MKKWARIGFLCGEHGFDSVARTFHVHMAEAMTIERAYYLQADPYERSVGRKVPCRCIQTQNFEKPAWQTAAPGPKA